MKLFIKILLVFAIMFLLCVVGATIFLTNDLKKNMNLSITDVDLSKLEDGTYNGVYGSGRWANEVEVTILENKITDINIIKTVMIEEPKTTDELIKRVIDKQKTNVDVISGATATSKSYLKSIEKALTK